MIKARTFSIVALLVFLITINAGAQKPKAPAPDYFPLRVGDSWTYRGTSGDTEYTIKVLEEEKPAAGGTIRYLVEKLAGAQVHTLFSKEGGWVFMHSERYPEHEGLEAKYEPARKYLPTPLVAGVKWEWSGKDYTQTEVKESNQVIGLESVTVPAGTFRAMKVVSEITAAARMTKTFWYADGVGLVKTTTDAGQIKYGAELTDYSFKKKDRSK
jgi:uncharacterized protein DUF3108